MVSEVGDSGVWDVRAQDFGFRVLTGDPKK